MTDVEFANVKKIFDECRMVIKLFFNEYYPDDGKIEENLDFLNKIPIAFIDADAATNASIYFASGDLTKAELRFYKSLGKTFINISDEEYLRIFSFILHECSHVFGRFTNKKFRLIKLEEGVADLFADSVLDFMIKKGIKICDNRLSIKNYKATSYNACAGIVKTTQALSSSDILYAYYFGNQTSLKQSAIYGYFKDVYGPSVVDAIFGIELSFKDPHYLMAAEKKILTFFLRRLSIEAIPPHLIHGNTFLCEYICKKLALEGLYTENEIRNKYPKLPQFFYESMKMQLSPFKKQAEECINGTLDKEHFAVDLLHYQCIPSIPPKTMTLSDIVNIVNRCSDMAPITFGTYLSYSTLFVPILIVYASRVNSGEDRGTFYKTAIQSSGYIAATDKDYYSVLNMVRHFETLFKDKSLEEIWKILETLSSTNIQDIIFLEEKKRQYRNGNLSDEQFLDFAVSRFNPPLYYPVNILKGVISEIATRKSKQGQRFLDLQLFDEILEETNKAVARCQLPIEYHVEGIIMEASFKPGAFSLLKFCEIVKSRDLHLSNYYPLTELLAQVVVDSNRRLEVEELDAAVESFTSPLFKENALNMREIISGRYSYNALLMTINSNIRKQILDRYIAGEKDIADRLRNNMKWHSFVTDYDKNEVAVTLRDAYVIELQKLQIDNPKKQRLIEDMTSKSIGHTSEISIPAILGVLNESAEPTALEVENNMQLLNDCPLIYWHYFIKLTNYGCKERYTHCIYREYSKYMRLKDSLPQIAEEVRKGLCLIIKDFRNGNTTNGYDLSNLKKILQIIFDDDFDEELRSSLATGLSSFASRVLDETKNNKYFNMRFHTADFDLILNGLESVYERYGMADLVEVFSDYQRFKEQYSVKN